MLPLPQAAEPGEENPDRGRRDPCNRVRDEEAGGFFPGEIRGWEETLVCWSVCLTGLLRWKNPFYLCFPSQWRKSILNFFLFTMKLRSAFCYCEFIPRLPSERGASQLAGTLQRPVGGSARALPVLPQEGAAQNQGGVRARAGNVPGDEAREETKLQHFLFIWNDLSRLPPDVCCRPRSSLQVSEEVRQYLKTPTFDNWWVWKRPVCRNYFLSSPEKRNNKDEKK